MTHDYNRYGTTTRFAALNVLDSRNMQRHRHQEFIRFLNAIEAQVPVGTIIHAASSVPSPICKLRSTDSRKWSRIVLAETTR